MSIILIVVAIIALFTGQFVIALLAFIAACLVENHK